MRMIFARRMYRRCHLLYIIEDGTLRDKTMSVLLTPVESCYMCHYDTQWRTEGGRGGGHDPRAQALEGAPGQLVGANLKNKIRPRQIRDRLKNTLKPMK